MDSAFDIPTRGQSPAGIVAAAGGSLSLLSNCPGSASPGCLVSLNINTVVDGAAVIDALIDPLVPVLPLGLVLTEPNADLSWQIFAGKSDKSINPEGQNVTGVYNALDFTLGRLRAGLNPLPATGPISRERPLRFRITNADAMNDAPMHGTMIGIATDRDGKVPEAVLRHYLSRYGNGRPEVISLCAKGYRCAGGYAEQPTDWCDGFFPPGTIAPFKLNRITLQAGVEQDIVFGPLQPCVPVAVTMVASAADTRFQVVDGETRKTAQIDGSPPLAAIALTGARGSFINGAYNPADFTALAIESGLNPFPWTQLGCVVDPRGMILRAVSAAGGTLDTTIWAQIAGDGKPGNLEFGAIPTEARIYATSSFPGYPAVP